jgi:hypothetical protein
VTADDVTLHLSERFPQGSIPEDPTAAPFFHVVRYAPASTVQTFPSVLLFSGYLSLTRFDFVITYQDFRFRSPRRCAFSVGFHVRQWLTPIV